MSGIVEVRPADWGPRSDDLACALLRGEAIGWPGAESGDEVEAFLARADFHGVLPLLDDHFRDASIAALWPETIRKRCRADALSWAAWDLAQRGEMARLLAAFRESQLSPLLLKGAALACTHYAHPALRPRSDLDLLVAEADKGRAEELMRALGYARQGVPMGPYISRQSTWSIVNGQGASNDVDLHWRSNNSPVLAKLLGHEEMKARAVGIQALGPDAFTPCPIHAILFACIHRAGHANAPMYVDGVAHPAKDRLIWFYDIHLLASGMSAAELEEVAALAVRKRMTAILGEALELCEARFGLQLPPAAKAALSQAGTDEPSARFLRGGRIRQMAGDLLALDGMGERIGWLREHAFPSADYMRAKSPAGNPPWLPALSARRAFSGLRKILLK